MDISKDTVKYVANLARIELSDSELDTFAAQLNDIVHYIDQLKEVDVSAISPTTHVLALKDVKRKDTLSPSLATEDVLKNAPHKEETFFKVPKVVE